MASEMELISHWKKDLPDRKRLLGDLMWRFSGADDCHIFSGSMGILSFLV
jgi:hypothetical protein